MKSIRLSRVKKQKLNALIAQANQSFSLNEYIACERQCKKIEQLVPGLPNTLNLRGSIAAIQGKLDVAVLLFSEAVKNAPEQQDFIANLARTHALMGNPEQAVSLYERLFLLAESKEKFNDQLDACHALIDLGAAKKAIELLLQLQKRWPENKKALAALASAYLTEDNTVAAKLLAQQLLEKGGEDITANSILARLEVQEGKLEQAEARFRVLLQQNPTMAIYSNIVQIKKYRRADDPDIQAVLQHYRQLSNNPEGREDACFALGKIFDDLNDSDKAFRYFDEGNHLRRRRTPYHEDLELNHIQQLIQTYDQAVTSTLKEYSTIPIFIVGMPRSGSTLTEQIIASHPLVEPRGECNAFECVALASQQSDGKLLTLEHIANFSDEQWQQVADVYMESVQDAECKTKRHFITDKSLVNIRMIGAIHRALPQAKIIHIRRHPLATCLSIFKKNLEGDLFSYGTNLRSLGRYYRAYQQLMAHWSTILPEGKMLEVNYESIIANQQKETLRMLEFCGLAWDDACLTFHKQKNQVNTASVAQVRRPIYQDSVAAWQRYEKHLQPLIDILGTDGWPATSS